MTQPIFARVSMILLLALGLTTAHANPADQYPRYGTFPAEWLDTVDRIYPIGETPGPIQWQAWLSVHAASKDRSGQPIVIEAFNSSHESAEKIRDYLVEHHKFPSNRFVIRENKARSAWDGWIVVRPSTVTLPSEAPNWTIPSIRTSLASPLRENDFENLQELSSESDAWSTRKKSILRPSLGVVWFSTESDPGLAARARPSWLGFRGQADVFLLSKNAFEGGVSAHYFGSIAALSPDAMGGSVTEASASVFGVYHADPSVIGSVDVRPSLTYFGSRRIVSTPGVATPIVQGIRPGLQLSTSFDEAIRFGINGSYTFTMDGVIDAGAFLSHRLFTSGGQTWEARLGLNATAVNFRDQGKRVQESWSAVQVGLSGSI